MNGPHLKDYYSYATEFASIAAAATQTQQINIETNSRFMAIKIGVFADIAGAVQTAATRVIPLLRLSINDTGSGLNLQNTPIPVGLLSGNGSLPFVLPIPREFKGNATINITFTNYSAATTYANVNFALIGYKIFNVG